MTRGTLPGIGQVDQPTRTGLLALDAKADVLTAADAALDARVDVLEAGARGWRNQIINGCQRIWQRGQPPPAGSSGGGYVFASDRFRVAFDGAGVTRTTTSYGDRANLVMPDGEQFYKSLRISQTVAGTGATYNVIVQPVEGADTLAGQTVTLSWYCWRLTGSGAIGANVTQVFGSGGSPSSSVAALTSTFTPASGWQRYSQTFTMPAVSSKTFGTNADDYVELQFSLPVNQVQDVLFTGIQLEAGSVATPFERRPVSLELSLCERFYETGTISHQYRPMIGGGLNFVSIDSTFRTTKRITPTVTGSFTNFDNAVSFGISYSTYSGFGVTAAASNPVFPYNNFQTDWVATCEL